jgi:uncharacterized membrane protein YccC
MARELSEAWQSHRDARNSEMGQLLGAGLLLLVGNMVRSANDHERAWRVAEAERQRDEAQRQREQAERERDYARELHELSVADSL